MSEMSSIEQVSLSLSVERNAIAPATCANKSRLERDLQAVREHVEAFFASASIPIPIHHRMSPFNICITQEFAQKLEVIHRLLDRALVDIVERWFTDKQADFPSRMPLEPHEEEVLGWISNQEYSESDLGKRLNFGKCSGMWRTDILFEDRNVEQPTICEINARIPFNGFYVTGLHRKATMTFGANQIGFDPPSDLKDTREVLFDCFDRSKPMFHILKKWPGVDSRLFGCDYKQATGQGVVQIEPSQLQLKVDDNSPTGWSLYANVSGNDGETSGLLKVEQCAVELFQEEFAKIDPALLKQLATCSVNDFRTIFLIHDKRILGIVRDEIANLVTRHVLSAEEGRILHDSIAETMTPGSQELRQLLEGTRQDPLAKNDWIVKPVRDASCNGIRLGGDMEQDEWVSLLERLSNKPLLPASDDAYVVQRLVQHAMYDIVRHDVAVTKTEKFHLIGSCHMINSQSFIFGPWRIGDKVHVGLGPDARGIVMSCVVKPADLKRLDARKKEE
ncbi:hypothetical protein TSTA_041060 [Talaromyces stipitatus ATCC 10500]|uniref:Uncharacterized protein n=1 Tax=Talaromyces stipitatus (strain ATCC 10500 / CBS 375.48 / QM 6759 / NRRL 1006) TaxID=441959 RepID=B8MIE3_TALSN|nr:uncharacterized protein TSTA_041060 [Talaromyces stipitatus ATCC 10500]EED14627.1 hypothetical protein TSTA_041060 [Talaromyces stipitatus ATCC 10500]